MTHFQSRKTDLVKLSKSIQASTICHANVSVADGSVPDWPTMDCALKLIKERLSVQDAGLKLWPVECVPVVPVLHAVLLAALLHSAVIPPLVDFSE